MTIATLIGSGLTALGLFLLHRRTGMGRQLHGAAAAGDAASLAQNMLARDMATEDLRRYIGFQRMEAPLFDSERGVVQYHAQPDGAPAEIAIHPADCAEFAAAAGREEAIVEFLPAEGQDFKSHLLILRGNRGGPCWATGLLVTLKPSRRIIDILAKQARLIDLGRAAATIGHEIKQPLFTIAVAAESLRILATKAHNRDDAAHMLDRIDRIADQVSRTQGIIEHISHYGKMDGDLSRHADIIEAARAAHGFLAPVIEEQRIDVEMTLADGRQEARASRIELEQVFVNALQNAVDAIGMRRSQGWDGAGRIAITVERKGATIRCRVMDNGVGLGPSVGISAFNAFFTTKSDKGTGIGLYISHGIVTRAGGTIALHPAEGGLSEREDAYEGEDRQNRQGTVLEIEFPATDPAAIA